MSLSHTTTKRIAFVCEGDAESSDKAFSGIAKSLVDHLRLLGHQVVAVNARPPKPLLAATAACTFSQSRATWRARFRYGDMAFRVRSLCAEKSLKNAPGAFDMILQAGGSITPPGDGTIPYMLYCDWNMTLSIRDRDNPHSAAHPLTLREAERINRREREVYQKAACIFTICERLRESFINDYGVDPDRVVAAYAGPNIAPSIFPAVGAARPPLPADHPPTILFVGKDFERKGGSELLKAFRTVRAAIPTARLVVIGPRELGTETPGVETLGLLRKDVPEEYERLLQAYREADLFCLPSLHDPFPTVVREAMFFGLPCITTNIWAFPEMVVDGETGYTVGVSDTTALADRMLRILRDPLLARRMGDAGRARAERMFTWSASVQKIQDKIQLL